MGKKQDLCPAAHLPPPDRKMIGLPLRHVSAGTMGRARVNKKFTLAERETANKMEEIKKADEAVGYYSPSHTSMLFWNCK